MCTHETRPREERRPTRDWDRRWRDGWCTFLRVYCPMSRRRILTDRNPFPSFETRREHCSLSSPHRSLQNQLGTASGRVIRFSLANKEFLSHRREGLVRPTVVIGFSISQGQLKERIVLVRRVIVLTTTGCFPFPFASDLLLITSIVILRNGIQSEFTRGIDTQGIEDIDILLVLRDLKRRDDG